MPFEFEKTIEQLSSLPDRHEAYWVTGRLKWIAGLYSVSDIPIDANFDKWKAGALHLRILEQYDHARNLGYTDETRHAILNIATDFAIETVLTDDVITKNWQEIQTA